MTRISVLVLLPLVFAACGDSSVTSPTAPSVLTSTLGFTPAGTPTPTTTPTPPPTPTPTIGTMPTPTPTLISGT